MRPATIEITVSRDGKKTISVEGAQGATCEAMTKPLEEALSGLELDREHKPSFYDRANVIVGS